LGLCSRGKKFSKARKNIFVSVQPAVAYEMDEGRNLATFPARFLARRG
jgi:hypothetical protein